MFQTIRETTAINFTRLSGTIGRRGEVKSRNLRMKTNQNRRTQLKWREWQFRHQVREAKKACWVVYWHVSARVRVPACVEVAHVCLAGDTNVGEVLMKPGVSNWIQVKATKTNHACLQSNWHASAWMRGWTSCTYCHARNCECMRDCDETTEWHSLVQVCCKKPVDKDLVFGH